MSRRTKLLTAALLLALLAAALVHTALTWSPTAPLRFRLIADHTIPGPPHGLNFRVLDIEIENTSLATIVTEGGMLLLKDGNSEYSVGGNSIFTDVTTTGPVPATLAPGARIRRQARLPHTLAVDMSLRDVVVSYSWMSHTKKRGRTLLMWLIQHVPSSSLNNGHLPRKVTTTAPLELTP